MAPGLLLLVALAAPPQFSVAVTRRVGVEPTKATELAQGLGQALETQGGRRLGTHLAPAAFQARAREAGARDATSCAGAVACAAGIGRAAGLQYVVSLQLVSLGSSLTFDARLIDVGPGLVLATHTGTHEGAVTPAALAELGRLLLAAWPAPTPDVPVQGVTTVSPTDAPPTPPLVDAVAPTPGWSTGRKVGAGLGVAAIVCAAGGVALGLSASAQSANLKATAKSYPDDKASVQRTALLADLSYGVALAAAVGAVVAWVQGAPAEGQPAVSIVPGAGGVLVTAQSSF